MLYNALLIVPTAALAVQLLRRPGWFAGAAAVTAQQAVGGILALFLAYVGGTGLFGALGLFAWCVFLHGPLLLSALAWGARRSRRGLAAAAAALALVAGLVYVDAFHVEPHWLEVSRYELASAKVTTPVRIVVIADMQTDAVGEYERAVVRRAMAEEPDLVLLPGDYVHLRRGLDGELARQHEELRRVFAEEGLGAPLGVHAVGGNTDGPGWERIFAGLPATAHTESATVAAGELLVTALDLGDSGGLSGPIAAGDGFHVVFGHRPDFALGPVDADLLLAGHCHGGQVRLPFLGPPVILSAIPRRWTEGLHEIRPGTWLCVSRGIGMERVGAPRMRFNCRPQLVVIDVVPAASR